MADSEIDPRVIARMIAYAFIEIRFYAGEGNDERCFQLADIFHVIPNVLFADAAMLRDTYKSLMEAANRYGLFEYVQGLEATAKQSICSTEA